MGMTCAIYRARADEVERLIANPDTLEAFLDPDSGSAPKVRSVRPKGLLGLVLRVLPITITETVPDSDDSAAPRAFDPDRVVDIDKAWHGLHFLFTGTADGGEEAASYLLRGGREIDDEGMTRVLMPDEVNRWAAYLSALTRDQLATRYDPDRMTMLEIYPDVIWSRPATPEDSPREWLLASFTELQVFVARAALAGESLVITIG
jgi:hypothetical protein